MFDTSMLYRKARISEVLLQEPRASKSLRVADATPVIRHDRLMRFTFEPNNFEFIS